MFAPAQQQGGLPDSAFVASLRNTVSCAVLCRRSADTIPSLTDRGTSIPHQGGRRPPGIAHETRATREPSKAPGVFKRSGVGAGAPAPVLDPPRTLKDQSAQYSASNQSAVKIVPSGSCLRIPKGFQRVLLQVISRKPFALQGFRTLAGCVIACLTLGLGCLIISLTRRYR